MTTTTARKARRAVLALLLALLPALLLALPLLAAAAKDDYLQPYKFVKPLKDLEELYSKHSTTPIAEARSDTGITIEEVVPDTLERKILMTDGLLAPEEEGLPQAQPLRDLKGRTRKRVLASDSKTRLGNHKTEDEEE